jgi:hypothetical protein
VLAGWLMGQVLVFARGKRPAPEQVERDTDAELVLFTGVRYQRQNPEDELPPDAEPKRENGA